LKGEKKKFKFFDIIISIYFGHMLIAISYHCH